MNQDKCLLQGIVVSIRHSEDIVAVWNKDSENQENTAALRYSGVALEAQRFLTLCRRASVIDVLGLPPRTRMEYKRHDMSLRDSSSYRNTLKM